MIRLYTISFIKDILSTRQRFTTYMSVINYPSDSYLSVIRCNDSRTACPNQPNVLHLISVAVSDSEASTCNRIISAFEENSK